jgi:5-methylcytosine-specific restriction endonuclease McrA
MNAKKCSEPCARKERLKQIIEKLSPKDKKRLDAIENQTTKLRRSRKVFIRDKILKERDKEKDGTIHCHYCNIDENDIEKCWEPIYAKNGKSSRRVLEVEHKNPKDKNGNKNNHLENLVLACPICNIAKSDQFSEEEFKKVGNVIRKIWQQRKKSKEQ